MFNLLPEQEKQKIHKQYRMRKAVVILMCAFVLIVSGGIFLLPTYVSLVFQEKDLTTQIKNFKSSTDNTKNAGLLETLRLGNQKITLTSNGIHSRLYYAMMQDLFKGKPSGVHLTGVLMLDRTEQNPKVIHVSLTGLADRRDDLVAYRDLLIAHTNYRNINLPVSSLAQDKHADFVLDIDILQ